MKTCPDCGRDVDDGLAFCVWCGARLGENRSALETAETVETEKPAASEPLDHDGPVTKPGNEPEVQEETGVSEDKPPRKTPDAVSLSRRAASVKPNRRSYLIVILAVLTVVVGTAIWLSLRPGKSGADETAQAPAEEVGDSRAQAGEEASAPGDAHPNGGVQSRKKAGGQAKKRRRPAPGRGTKKAAGAPGHSQVSASHGRASRSGLITKQVDVSSLPRWPAPAAIVYAGKNFRGRRQTFGVGAVPHLRGTRLGDNAATSLDLVGGARLTLYLKPGYTGRKETFVNAVQSLKHSKIRNNRASSLRVDPPDVGPILWKSGPVYSLGLTFEIERGRDGLVVLYGEDRTATYVSSSLVPRAGPGLEKLLQGSSSLRRSLGSPVTHGVRLENGKLAVQLFQHGVLAYAPGSERGWYQLDPR